MENNKQNIVAGIEHRIYLSIAAAAATGSAVTEAEQIWRVL